MSTSTRFTALTAEEVLLRKARSMDGSERKVSSSHLLPLLPAPLPSFELASLSRFLPCPCKGFNSSPITAPPQPHPHAVLPLLLSAEGILLLPAVAAVWGGRYACRAPDSAATGDAASRPAAASSASSDPPSGCCPLWKASPTARNSQNKTVIDGNED